MRASSSRASPSEQLQFSMLAQIMERFPSIDTLDMYSRHMESEGAVEMEKDVGERAPVSDEALAATKIQALHAKLYRAELIAQALQRAARIDRARRCETGR